MIETPLLVGVTGHRDLTEKSSAQAKNQVVSFLSELKTSIPNTPIKLISGLADGADRLVAQVALDLGVSVQAVFPMPMAMYEKDFSHESLQDLNRLIEDENVELIELPVPADIDISKAGGSGPERDSLYAQLGEYLIQRSSILIALWDGRNSNLRGGTSDIILRYLKAGGADITDDGDICFLDKVSIQAVGPEFVFWSSVSRKSDGEHIENYHSEQGVYLTGDIGPNTLYRQTSFPKELLLQIQYLDAYNKQYTELVADDSLVTWGGMLEKLPNGEEHPEYPVLKAIDDEYQKADAMALYNQKHSNRKFKLFGYMAALMGLLFLFYAKILAAKIFLVGYLVLLIAGLWMFRGVDRNQWFANHLMQRVIAETLRTRFFLILAGVDRRVNVDKMLDLTGVSQFSGFSWIQQIFGSHQSLPFGTTKHLDLQKKDVEFVCKGWLDDQAAYFKSKIERLSTEHHKLEKIKSRLLMASGIAVVLLILFKTHLASTVLVGSLDMKTLLVFFMGLLPFWLGVWEIYQSKMAVKELLWQYRNQSNMFNQAGIQVSHSKTMEEKRRVITELGKKSLMENYLWTIHRYHREHEPPTAG